MVKTEPEDDSDFEDAKSKKNTRNPSTLANLTSPVSSNASSFDNDFDLSGWYCFLLVLYKIKCLSF